MIARSLIANLWQQRSAYSQYTEKRCNANDSEIQFSFLVITIQSIMVVALVSYSFIHRNPGTDSPLKNQTPNAEATGLIPKGPSMSPFLV